MMTNPLPYNKIDQKTFDLINENERKGFQSGSKLKLRKEHRPIAKFCSKILKLFRMR